MHTNIMKLVYTHNELLHVVSKHVATFIRDVKYKGYIYILQCKKVKQSCYRPGVAQRVPGS